MKQKQKTGWPKTAYAIQSVKEGVEEVGGGNLFRLVQLVVHLIQRH